MLKASGVEESKKHAMTESFMEVLMASTLDNPSIAGEIEH
jgi:hypothetical protein